MNGITITDNVNEMIKIGKEIFSAKSDIYDERMKNIVLNAIDEFMPADKYSQAEKEDMYYRSIYDYWVYGNNIREEFYYKFHEKKHDEKKNYITWRNRFQYIYQINDINDKHLVNDKYEAYKLLEPFYKRDAVLIRNKDDFDKFCEFVDKHESFIVKPVDLGLAVGVHKDCVPKGEDKRVVFDRILAEGVACKEANPNSNSTGHVVLEQLIEQSESFGKMHPDSVNCIRITTIRTEEGTNIFYPYFRVGTNGNFIVNAALGSIIAGINVETGIIETNGFTEACNEYEVHPNTGVAFKGYVMPEWDQLIKMIKEAADKLPTLSYIGWDVTHTDNGWCIIEGNFAGECLGQLAYGKGLRYELEDLINKKAKNEFWWQK